MSSGPKSGVGRGGSGAVDALGGLNAGASSHAVAVTCADRATWRIEIWGFGIGAWGLGFGGRASEFPETVKSDGARHSVGRFVREGGDRGGKTGGRIERWGVEPRGCCHSG